MKKNYLWTNLKSRLLLAKSKAGAAYNWVFLPGGPGLGSETLLPLIHLLNLPGTSWCLDLPGDGSNATPDDSLYFAQWSEALVEAVGTLDNVILVAHSTGGMYALATPALKHLLTGLVLMDSAPDAQWQQHFMSYVSAHPIAGLNELHQLYAANPNNEMLKELTLLSAPYLFTSAGLQADISFLQTLPYNFRTCEWSAQHFDSEYAALWVPQNIPVLIFTGEQDKITPLHLFEDNKLFQRPNIQIHSISNAGHFPWIENPQEVLVVFEEYYGVLQAVTTSLSSPRVRV